MKKIILSSFTIGSFILYSLTQQNQAATLPMQQSQINQGSSPNNSGIQNQSTRTYKDGQYTGTVADAFYGNVQVSAAIQGGKITDVQFLQYPNDRPQSRMISMYSTPQLKQEAIQAQSANADIISGATDTSQAFIQSLSSALSQAQ